MKKFLLFWVVWLLWFIGFSNATSLVVWWNSTSSITLNDQSVTSMTASCSLDSCVCTINYNWDEWCQIMYDWDYLDNDECMWYMWEEQSGVYTLGDDCDFDSISVTVSSSQSSWWWGAWDNWNTWDSSPLMSSLSSVIGWLVSTVWELIPYVIYIWLWILVAVLWFIAIKRLLNWISRKIFGNFKY